MSFQLSFTAIIGILFILPILEKYIFKQQDPVHKQISFNTVYKYIISALLVSLAATLATAPITVSVFNRVSTIGPLANLVLEPLICLWCLPAGIIALPFIWLSPETANVLLHFGTYGINSALYVAQLLTSFPLASLFLSTPPLHHIVLYFIVIYFFVSGLIKKPIKIVILFFTSLILFTVFYDNVVPFFDSQRAKVSFIDVGQGSATLIEKGASTVLIDGGGSSFSNRSVGETVIAPFLWSKGIQTVDVIVITHPDADHYNGLEYILNHFSPRLIWVRDVHGHDRKYQRFIKLAQKKNVQVITPEAGDILSEDGINLQCLANLKDRNFKNARSGSSANTGLVIKVCFMKHCFLFPGDINISMEQFILQQHIDIKADTLLSAHHGSKTSNSSDFLFAVSPRHTIVSAATSSKGFFPHQRFLDKCKALNIEVLNTSQDGTIEFTMDNNGTTLRTTNKFQQNPLYPMVFFPKNEIKQKRVHKNPE